MGGYGAYELGLLQPGRFCAVGGHSPAVFASAGETAAGAFDDAEDFDSHNPITRRRRTRVNSGRRSSGWIRATRIRSSRVTITRRRPQVLRRPPGALEGAGRTRLRLLGLQVAGLPRLLRKGSGALLMSSNVDLVKAWVDACNAGDPDGALALCDESMVLVESAALPGAVTATGRDQVRHYLERFEVHWSEGKWTPVEFREADDKVMLRARLRLVGRNSGIEVDGSGSTSSRSRTASSFAKTASKISPRVCAPPGSATRRRNERRGGGAAVAERIVSLGGPRCSFRSRQQWSQPDSNRRHPRCKPTLYQLSYGPTAPIVGRGRCGRTRRAGIRRASRFTSGLSTRFRRV